MHRPLGFVLVRGVKGMIGWTKHKVCSMFHIGYLVLLN